jgi:hypothetical protein
VFHLNKSGLGMSPSRTFDLAAACEPAKRTIKMAGAGKIEVREIASAD